MSIYNLCSAPANQRRLFHFQAAWTTHAEFQNVVKDNWDVSKPVMDNIPRMTEAFKKWNKIDFGDIQKKNKRCLARLNGIQNKLMTNHDNGLIKLERKVRGQLNDILTQEELFWFQRSREEWIQSGDRNTKFYHAFARIHGTKNRKLTLMNHDESTIIDETTSKAMVQGFFVNLFTAEQVSSINNLPRGRFPKLNENMWNAVNAPFTQEEIKDALSSMSPYKVAGPDGYHAGFYQRAWDIVGNSIYSQTQDFLESGIMPEELNDTFVALIPKMSNPWTAGHFRSISLCNVCYKIITKT